MKKRGQMHCKQRGNAERVFACPDTLYNICLLLIYGRFMTKDGKRKQLMTEDVVSVAQHSFSQLSMSTIYLFWKGLSTTFVKLLR